jgi:transposase
MSIVSLLIPFSLFVVEQLEASQEGIVLGVRSMAEDGSCPGCQTSSSRVHSRYLRTVKDLPVSGIPLTLRLQVRRFFCDNPACRRKTFAEAVPELAHPFARKTVRLTEQLRQLGFAIGAEQGARSATVLKMSCSADTVLRLIRTPPLSPHATPTYLGVDDWAFRRNVSYGTILVDLQDHQVVDLLPDRSAGSLENWLKAHPGVQLISRDRSGDYALGARLGAPDALQVADRFHIQKNLGEAVERVFHRHRETLQQMKVVSAAPSMRGVVDPLLRPERLGQREQTRTKRMQRYEEVRALYLQGISLSEIARRLHMGRMTVQKFAYADSYPETAAYQVKAGMLHPYESYLRERWQQGSRNGAQLYREVVAMGYPGKRKQVARLVAYLRKQTKAGVTDFSTQPQGLTPRAAVSLLMCRPENWAKQQKQTLAQMGQVQEIAQVMELVDRFLTMLRPLQGEQLEDWMQAAQQSHIREMQNFVEKLRKDQQAVQAGLTLTWNNGVVEGHVNRLKCLKRMMYGHAQFDLLRQRVLYRSPSPPSPASTQSFHAMCG